MVVTFILLAALIHTYIFILESVRWEHPNTRRVFRMSAEQASQTRLFAFNQGFYNLFLAIGAIFGCICLWQGQWVAGNTLILFSGGSMLCASLVLLVSNPKLIRAVVIQGGPPLVALIFLGFRLNG